MHSPRLRRASMCVRGFGVLLFRISRTSFLRGAAVLVLIWCIGIAVAQVELPEVVVRAAKPKPQPKPTATAHPVPAAQVRAAPPRTAAQPTAAEQLAARTTVLN